MQILILAQFYPPDIGGEERHVRNLAVSLVGRGHEVDVITTALPNTDSGETEEDGVQVVRVRTSAQQIGRLHSDRHRPHAMPFVDPKMSRVISRLVDERRYDIAHAHNWIVNSAVGPMRRARVPLVLTLHDYSHVCATKRYMYRGENPCLGPSLGRCLRCASGRYGSLIGTGTVFANLVSAQRRQSAVSAFVAVSTAVAERNLLADNGVPFTVIPNFIPDELLVTEPRANRRGPVLFVGDLTRDKGVEVLCEAFQGFPEPTRLLLVGRPDPSVCLSGVSTAQVVGPLSHDELMGLMRSALLVLVPSIWPDPCPTVVLEAMAAGRPVVASAIGGITDMVEDGVTGRLVPPGEPAALAEAVAGLVQAPDVMAAMGQRSLEQVRRFTASIVVERIERLYARVLETDGQNTRQDRAA